MSEQPVQEIVVADANVLINFIHLGKLGLLCSLPGYRFIVPEQVFAEVNEASQRAALQAAIQAGVLRVERITRPDLLLDYSQLCQFLGPGESACLVIAGEHGWKIASDDRRRLPAEAQARLGPGRVLTTPDLILAAIRAGLMSVEEADAAKALLEQRRFRMRFRSFGDVH
ncbi:MAG: hypothetical protein HYZ53_08580 [Planctomycetes bacterium]|nr:hypothetical protein [Planctomycetota bacterium]